MVISSGEKELYRVSQTVHDNVEFCVPPAFGTAHRLIRRFFPAICAFMHLYASGVHAQVLPPFPN